jgi:hypothetical protein
MLVRYGIAMVLWINSLLWQQILISNLFNGAGRGEFLVLALLRNILLNYRLSNHQPMHATM